MFAGVIRAAVADLQYGEHTHDLQASGLLNQVTKKLPPTLMSKWGEYLFSIQPRAATLIDLDRWLDSRVLVGTWTHEYIPSKAKDGKDDSKKKSSSTKQSGGPRVFMTKTPTPCICCSETSHDLPSCPTFKKMEPKQRAELVFENKCCFRCLKTGHVNRECSIEVRCVHTNYKSFHHPMVHGAPRLSTKSQSKENSDSTPPTGEEKFCGMTANRSRVDIVLLAVVPVVLKANGKRIETFALLDTGSQVTMLKASILEQLGVNPPNKITRFGTYHGQDPEVSIQKAKLTLCSRDGRVTLPLNVSALDTLNLSQRSINWPRVNHRWSHLKDLDLEAIESNQISVLIGSDSQESHLILDYRRPSDGKEGPWAVLTQFGSSVRGPVSSKQLQVRPQDDPTSLHIHGPTEQSTWMKQRRNLAVGDVVLIVDSSTPRGLWLLGRVSEIFPGADGVVRSAKVINKHGEYHRPIADLCLLEVSTSEDVSVLEENRAGYVPDLAIGIDSDTSDEGATFGERRADDLSGEEKLV